MSRPDAVVMGSGPNGLTAASSAIHPFAIASPIFRTLPLAAHGLEWIEPPVMLAHPFDDGDAACVYRSLERTAEGLGADRSNRCCESPGIVFPTGTAALSSGIATAWGSTKWIGRSTLRCPGEIRSVGARVPFISVAPSTRSRRRSGMPGAAATRRALTSCWRSRRCSTSLARRTGVMSCGPLHRTDLLMDVNGAGREHGCARDLPWVLRTSRRSKHGRTYKTTTPRARCVRAGYRGEPVRSRSARRRSHFRPRLAPRACLCGTTPQDRV